VNTNTEGVSIALGVETETEASMCAFECDNERHEGILTVCVFLWTQSEVNKY